MKLKNHLKIALASSFGLAGAHTGFVYMADKLFKENFTLSEKQKQQALEATIPESLKPIYNAQFNELARWYNSADKESLILNSIDGLKLYGTLLKIKEGEPYLIMLHDYGQKGLSLLKQAYEFAQKNFNILLIDQRCHGLSQGEYISYGLKESIDLIQWIQYLCAHDKEAKICLYGVGMGGAAIAIALGNEISNNVGCAIIEGAYRDLKSLVESQMDQKNTPDVLNRIYLNQRLKKYLNMRIEDVDLSLTLSNNEIPICFVYSNSDEVVPLIDGKILYNANKGKKYFYPLKYAKHSYGAYEEDYFDILTSFIDSYL